MFSFLYVFCVCAIVVCFGVDYFVSFGAVCVFVVVVLWLLCVCRVIV